MRVIVTGGTGLIGRALAKNLLKAGYEVILLSRNPQQHEPRAPRGARLVRWDGRSAEGWASYADGAGAIVNLAGENISAGRWTERRKASILSSRVDPGKAIVQAIRQVSQKPQVVIQSSAIGYYGSHGDEAVTEQDHSGQDFFSEVCRQWEASSAEIEALGVRRVIIRSGVVLDARQGALPKMALPVKLFIGGPLGNGKQWFSWIHLEDEIAAIQYLIENEQASGAFNLTAPNPLTNAQFTRVLAGVLRRPAWIPVPAFVLKLLFGEMAMVLLEGQKVLPSRLTELGYTFIYPQAEAALKAIYR